MSGQQMVKSFGLCVNIFSSKKEDKSMQVSKKIKLEISDRDAATLEFMQAKCRGLYNWWVMKLRNGEDWPGTLIAKKTLKDSRKVDPELNHVYNKLLQE